MAGRRGLLAACLLLPLALSGCGGAGDAAESAPSGSHSPAASAAGPATTAFPSATATKVSSGTPTGPTATPQAADWPGGATLQVVGLGDSVMSSEHCGCDGPVVEYATGLHALMNMSVQEQNLGRSGATAAELAAQLADDQQLRTAVAGADVVLLTIGANDVAPLAERWQSCSSSCWGPVVQQMSANLASILDEIGQLREGHPTRILVSNYWNVAADGSQVASSLGADRVNWTRTLTSATNQAIADAAAAHGGRLVDLVEPFMGSSSNGDPAGKLLDDGDHPNAAGVAAMAKAFLDRTE